MTPSHSRRTFDEWRGPPPTTDRECGLVEWRHMTKLLWEAWQASREWRGNERAAGLLKRVERARAEFEQEGGDK